MQSRESDDYFICSHCGAEVSIQAQVCRECGASEDAGWGDDTGPYDGDDDFDYDEFIEREFPEHAPPRPVRVSAGRAFRFSIVALLILAMVWLMFGWTCRA